MKVKDLFTGEGTDFVVEAIGMYEKNDIKGLNELPKAYEAEAKIVMAICLEPSLGEQEFEPERFEELIEVSDELLSDIDIDYKEIHLNFKIVLVKNIMSYRRFGVIQNAQIAQYLTPQEQEGLEYALATKNKRIDEIDTEHRLKYITELISVLNLFGLSLDHYNDSSVT